MNTPYSLEPLGECALLLRLGDALDGETNRRVHLLASLIGRHAPPWLVDVVPAFASLALCLDPLAFDSDSDPQQLVSDWLATLDTDSNGSVPVVPVRTHRIPVRYGGEQGPDLEAVAEHCGLSPAEVIRLHTAPLYRVGMLGFAAGFPYLLGMDPRLAMPRRANPRTCVAAGSVGIGGSQTGIYPRQGPGGWQIIGCTELTLFDCQRDPPALAGPGDCIRFVDAGSDPAEPSS